MADQATTSLSGISSNMLRASLTRPASKYDLMTLVARNEGGLGENGELKWAREHSVRCEGEEGIIGARVES